MLPYVSVKISAFCEARGATSEEGGFAAWPVAQHTATSDPLTIVSIVPPLRAFPPI